MRFLVFLLALTGVAVALPGCAAPVGGVADPSPVVGSKADDASTCDGLATYVVERCGEPLEYGACLAAHPDEDMRPTALACCASQEQAWCDELGGDRALSARRVTGPRPVPSWAGAMTLDAQLAAKALDRAVLIRLVDLAKGLFGDSCDAVPNGYEAELEETTLDEMFSYLDRATRFDPAAATTVLPEEVTALRLGIEHHDRSVGAFRVFRGDLLGYACGADGLGRFYLAIDGAHGKVLYVRVVEIAD